MLLYKVPVRISPNRYTLSEQSYPSNMKALFLLPFCHARRGESGPRQACLSESTHSPLLIRRNAAARRNEVEPSWHGKGEDKVRRKWTETSVLVEESAFSCPYKAERRSEEKRSGTELAWQRRSKSKEKVDRDKRACRRVPLTFSLILHIVS